MAEQEEKIWQLEVISKESILSDVAKIIDWKVEFSDMFLSQASKVVIAFYLELRWASLQQYQYHIEEIKKLIKKWISPRDLLNAIWRLQHSSFANNRQVWVWGWSLSYFYRKNNTIEKSLKNFQFDIQPTEKEILVAKKYEYLLQEKVETEDEKISKLKEINNTNLK